MWVGGWINIEIDREREKRKGPEIIKQCGPAIGPPVRVLSLVVFDREREREKRERERE